MRPARKPHAVRLALEELERREVASETLWFLAAGIALNDGNASSPPPPVI